VEVTKHDDAVVVGTDIPAGRMPAMPTKFPAYEKLFVLDPDAYSVVVARAALEQRRIGHHRIAHAVGRHG